MRYRTEDGLELQATTARGLVRALKRRAWSAPDRKGAYMEEVAHRVQDATGCHVRTSTAELFVADLQAAGVLTEVA